MTMKRILAAAGCAIAAAVSLAPAATAQAEAAPNCQYGDSYGTRVTSAAVGGMGAVQLCRDSSYRYWAFLLLTRSPSSGRHGQGYLERYRDGKWESYVTCDSSGGNGKVLPGQTRCWTPKFTGLSGHYTFRAWGAVFDNPRPHDPVASGYTSLTR
ncbi:hypothetical protein AB5J62_16345 [Amycolatopsis sp. cg5]|uniref:hypothetical protein n=1 Tax=Amycolatopsis sp. cg5 TaxID=3238802 RepID=UPI003524CCEB